jgi:hypothetical protein
MSNYVYIKSLASDYSVGFFRPDGTFVPESKFDQAASAAQHVHFLNGGVSLEPVIDAVQRVADRLRAIEVELDLLRTAK